MIDSQAGSSCLNASNGVDGHFKEIPIAVGESSLGVNFFVLILFEEGKQIMFGSVTRGVINISCETHFARRSQAKKRSTIWRYK